MVSRSLRAVNDERCPRVRALTLQQVNFTDGTSFAFSRRERPHIIWAAPSGGGSGGAAAAPQPIALTNGVEYGAHANTAGEDTIYTLMQPLRTA